MAKTKDPDLHLIVDGVPVRPHSASGGVYTFRVGPGARRIIIASRSIVPVEVGGQDPRRLGVPMHRLVLKGASGSTEIGPEHPGLTDGFHQNEGSHRWTNGRGVIRSEVVAASAGELTVEVHIGTIDLEYPA